MFDTHAHVNFSAYKNDADAVIRRAREKGVTIINVGSQLSTSQRAVEMAQAYENVYAAVGLHPIQLEETEFNEEGVVFRTRQEDFDYQKYRQLARQNKVVAIGETGLDYYRFPSKRPAAEVITKQKDVFLQHIKLANESNLPLIVHCRGTKENMDSAYNDILAILQSQPVGKRGVMHCYLGALELVEKFLALGFYFGFNGVLTFDKTGRLAKILEQLPLARVLIETDCPYLTPVPYRGQRNEPVFVELVAQKIAELKHLPLAEIINVTDNNARELFSVI